MTPLRRQDWLRISILGLALVELALLPTLAFRWIGEAPDPVRSWQMLLCWGSAIALIGASVTRGGELGWRELLAIVPGLLVADRLPKAAAIAVACGLGAVLLLRSRRGARAVGAPDAPSRAA